MTITTPTRRKLPTVPEIAANPDTPAARYVTAHGLATYLRMYTKGWRTTASNEYLDDQHLFDDDAFMDGFLDKGADREKWHLTRCSHHDECG